MTRLIPCREKSFSLTWSFQICLWDSQGQDSVSYWECSEWHWGMQGQENITHSGHSDWYWSWAVDWMTGNWFLAGTRQCHLLRVFWMALGYAGTRKYHSFRAFWLVLESTGTRDFHFFRASILALGSIYWTGIRTLFPRVKWPKYEGDHSSSVVPGLKMSWCCSSILPCTFMEFIGMTVVGKLWWCMLPQYLNVSHLSGRC